MCKRSPSTVMLRTLYCAGLSNTSTAYLRKLEWNKLNMVVACFSSLEPDFVHRFASALICSRRRENLPRRRRGRAPGNGGGGGEEVRTAIRWMSLSNDLCSANGSRTSRHCLCHCEGMLTYKMLILRHCNKRTCLHTFRSIAQQCIS